MDELRVLHVSNLLELFGPSTQAVSDPNLLVPMRQAYKASQWAEPGGMGYALLAQEAPDVPSRFGAVWKPPDRVFSGGDETQYRGISNSSLTEEILDWLGPVRRLQVVATAQSEPLHRLVAVLRERLPGLVVEGVSDMPVGAIRRLNTKTGGRRFMREAGIGEEELAPQTLFPTLDAALSWLAGVARGTSFMLKANAALGGFGVVHFRAGVPLSEGVLEALRGRRRHAASWKAIGTVDDGVVVEAVVGSFPSNWSVTADFACDPAGTVALGMADQVLKGGVGYRGFRSAPNHGWRASERRIEEIGRRLGAALAGRGYAGPFNIDVVVPRAEPARCFLIEINVRRSAPLSGFLLLRRLFGPMWMDAVHVEMTEDSALTGRARHLDDLLEFLDERSLCYDSTTGQGVVPFLADAATRRFAGMIVSLKEAGLRRLTKELGAVLQHG